MSDRLKELQRQRALAQEQVAWFDREIAREQGATSQPPAAPEIPFVRGGVPSPHNASPADGDRILDQYRSSGTSIKSEVRRGCFLYFFAAFALVALGAVAFYLLWRR